MARAIDEKRRGAVHTAPYSANEVLSHPRRINLVLHLRRKAFDIKSEFFCVPNQALDVERRLVFEQRVAHLPEFALPACGFGCFGGAFRVLVDRCERKVPESKTQIVAKVPL